MSRRNTRIISVEQREGCDVNLLFLKSEATGNESILEAGGRTGSFGGNGFFQKALDSANVELKNDVMNCWVNGDILYCALSRYNPQHPYHKCLPW